MATVKLYGFIAEELGKREVKVEIKETTVRDLLHEIAQKANIKLFENGEVIPTLLILIDGKEYKSLGLLDERLEGTEEIKLVPTFHGGIS